MKRLLAGAFCLCLLLSGCNRSNPSPADPLHLELCPVTNSVTDSNGTEVLTLTYPEPKLSRCDDAVASRIMDDLKGRIADYRSDGAALEEAARAAAAEVKAVGAVAHPGQFFGIVPNSILPGHKAMTDDGNRKTITIRTILRTPDGQTAPLTFKGGFCKRFLHL